MNETFRLGTIRGIAVGVNWTVFVIIGVVTWSLGSAILPDTAPGYGQAAYWLAATCGAFGLVAAILAHELSHAVVAERLGVEVKEITLWMFGGVSKFDTDARDARSELRIAIAGPAMSVVVACASFLVAAVVVGVGGPDLLASTLAWLGTINIMLAIFNLLPGAPLDGGRVLAAVLWHRSGDEHQSKRRSAAVGRTLGQVLIALGIVEYALGGGIGGIWLIFLGWFLTSAARTEEASEAVVAVLGRVKVADVMSSPVLTADAAMVVDHFVRHVAATSHVSSFPVLDGNGSVMGLVTLRQLRALPRDAWSNSTLGAIAVPIDQLALARSDELLLDAVRRAGRSEGRILVLDNGLLTGIVTPTDVAKAIERLDLVQGDRSSRGESLRGPLDTSATHRH